MRTIKLVYDDFTNKVEVLRHASRGIVIKEDKILLSYMKKYDLYLLPGGGKEGLETLSDACERELHEETGYLVEAKELYLDIEEYFDNWCHINHYFICNLLEGKSQQNLTKEEKEAGLVPIFVNIDEALEIFSKYEDYKYNNIHKYG
ncbi:MAG: NUDIX domain-containing protein, partial [Acholeplasmatales bacterium]|nr:NUDIX domain-containing protein [Acholeplasmatales bacterium]